MRGTTTSLILEPGTVAHATQQLLLWSQSVRDGLTRVEGDDPRSQITAVIRLRRELRDLNIATTQLMLAPSENPISAICALIDELESLPPSLVFIRGLNDEMLANRDEFAEALRFFDYELKNRRMGAHRQIWWVSTKVGQFIATQLPQFQKRFTHRLQLVERSWEPPSASRATRRFASTTQRSLDDVHHVRAVVSFLYRRGFNWALAANRPVREIIVDLISPGVKALLDVGLDSDARNFSNSCLTALSIRESERSNAAVAEEDAALEPDFSVDESLLADEPIAEPLGGPVDERESPEWVLFADRDPESGQSWLDYNFPEGPGNVAMMDTGMINNWVAKLTSQAQNAQLLRRYDEAENLLMEALGLNARKYGWGHASTLVTLRDLALLVEDRGEDQYEPWMEAL